jgi:hypothetical protein
LTAEYGSYDAVSQHKTLQDLQVISVDSNNLNLFDSALFINGHSSAGE